jgi:hypothetical protein
MFVLIAAFDGQALEDSSPATQALNDKAIQL